MPRAGIPRFSLSTRYFVLCTPHLGGAMHEQILAALSKPNYVPLKPKALARKVGVKDSAYAEFRKALRDLAAKGAHPDDKVVFEMLRFPTVDDRGEGVITEVLGPRGAPGVDTLSVIRAFGLPDAFPADVLEEARAAAEQFNERDLENRENLIKELTVTIDPVDARDFDDAVSLTKDAKTGHWLLGVHIADVAHFAPSGSALD